MDESKPSEGPYAGKRLEGAHFTGADLRGADFAGADLRGADFRGARLNDAIFRRASFGMSRLWVAVFVASSLAIGGFAGAVGARIGQSMSTQATNGELVAPAFVFAMFLTFILLTLILGLSAAVRIGLAVLVTTTLLVTIGTLGAGAFEPRVFLVPLMLAVLMMSFVAGAVARVAAGSFGIIAFVVISLVAASIAWLNGGGLFLSASLLVSVFLARRALGGDVRDRWIRRLSVEVVGTRGTCFADADLTNADFDGAYLGVSDFRGAVLAGTMFENAKVTSGALFDPSVHPRRRCHAAEE